MSKIKSQRQYLKTHVHPRKEVLEQEAIRQLEKTILKTFPKRNSLEGLYC
jgi:hypothetical protein